MQLYKKYIIKNLFKPFLISVSVLTILIWSTRVIKYTRYIVEDGAEFFAFLKLTMAVLPFLILLIIPLSLSLTAILTYNKFIENREIIILKNCGIKKIQLLTPLIYLSICITIILYVISIYVMYKSNLTMIKIRNDIKNNLSMSLIKDGVFAEFQNITIYSDSKKENKAYNIMIYQKSTKKDEKNILLQAQSAVINANIITLYNGNFQNFDTQHNNNPNILFFDEYSIDFNELSMDESKMKIRIDSLSTIELFKLLKNKNDSYNNILFELNYRLGFPLLAIIIPLFSGSIILNEAFNRVSTNKILIKSGIISLLSYIISLFLFYKIKNNPLFIYVLYFTITLIFLYSLYLIKERKNI